MRRASNCENVFVCVNLIYVRDFLCIFFVSLLLALSSQLWAANDWSCVCVCMCAMRVKCLLFCWIHRFHYFWSWSEKFIRYLIKKNWFSFFLSFFGYKYTSERYRLPGLVLYVIPSRQRTPSIWIQKRPPHWITNINTRKTIRCVWMCHQPEQKTESKEKEMTEQHRFTSWSIPFHRWSTKNCSEKKQQQ